MKTPGWVGLRPAKMSSLKLVRNDQGFAWNLIKSLIILWLMSLLVTIISIFCSTFLSWPIAVVLTMVILFGRWGAMQLGDVTDPGLAGAWPRICSKAATRPLIAPSASRSMRW